MKKILILEDNEKHMEALVKLLSSIDNIEISKAYNMAEACYMLSLNEYNLFLVDIVLDTERSGDVSGMDFVNLIRDNKKYQFTPVIFITSLEDPELCAYRDLHCYQYIEKPFEEDYVLKVIKEGLNYNPQIEKKENAYFRKEGVLYSVKIKDIVRIDISRSGIEIFTVRDVLHLGYQTVSDILRELASDDFIQCNRRTIINLNHIEFVDYINRYIKLRNIDEFIEIGATMKNDIKKLLEEEV